MIQAVEPSNVDAIKALTKAVEKLHGVSAVFTESTPVHEQFNGLTVWQGVVSSFDLMSKPVAHCYAWSVPADDDRGERFCSVLQTTETNTPEKAVKASIVSDHRRAATR